MTELIGVWTALDHITRENGCLVVIPGTRSEGLRRAIAVHYASAHCEDIWRGETKTIGNFNPRLDIRLVRGQDPNRYAQPGP